MSHQKLPPLPVRQVAYHEAGHAFMCWHLGARPMTAVLLEGAGPGRAGSCHYGPARGRDPRALARADILTHVAGRAAERQLLGREPDRPMLSDAAKALELARTLTGSQRDARQLVVTLYNDACVLVAAPHNWPAVAALAQALLRRGQLSGDDVDRLARGLRLD